MLQKKHKIIKNDKLSNYLLTRKILVLDGALATELTHRGCNLNHELWSAKILLEQPELIQQVHYDYLIAGADIVISASYQATLEGFQKIDLSLQKAKELLQLSVHLAKQAVETFWRIPENRVNRCYPLVAASVGPYGAFLADGSEYSGNYGLSQQALEDFHYKRMEILIQANPDILAFETIPCLVEARALIKVLAAFPNQTAWLSFSCQNDEEISSGEVFEKAITLANTSEQIIAVGVNCTAPEYIESLLNIAHEKTSKPLIVYPNSGEKWNAEQHCWVEESRQGHLSDWVIKWQKAGARIMGGCCRTSPMDIQNIKKMLRESSIFCKK